MFKFGIHQILILFITIAFIFPITGFSQERESLDFVLSENDKADVLDIIETSKNISSESQTKIKDVLAKWGELERNFANLPPEMQQFVNKLNAEGLKTKLNATLEKFEEYDAGLKSLMDKKEKIDQVIYFYDRYRPDSQNPFRSLEVLNNIFTDAESLLPEETEYEYIKNPTAWLIRVGIRYFRTGIGNALSGLKNIQKQIKDRAGNCIGYVGGDGTADSSDPKRKAFTDLNTGDIICYTGIRPVGGEIWSNTNGDGVLIWSSEKWTKLNCGLGTVNNIFSEYKLAMGSVLSAERMIYWCNTRLFLYEQLKSSAKTEYFKLSNISPCQRDILLIRGKQNDFDEFMHYVAIDEKTFIAKYIFSDNFIQHVTSFSKIISNSVLFEGRITNKSGTGVAAAEVSIITDEKSKTTTTSDYGTIRMLLEIPENKRDNLPLEIKVSAAGYSAFKTNSRIFSQCLNLGTIELDKPGELTITPEKSEINIGETVEFTVLFNDGINETDVTSEALSNAVFKGIEKGNFTIQALYMNFVATASIDVVEEEQEEKCPEDNEIWDETINDCRCIDGYEKNENDKCVEIEEEPEEVICTDPNAEKVWDDSEQKFVCQCKENYIPDPVTGLCAEDVNSIINNSDCANAEGAVAKWDAVNKVVVCSCTDDYYTWDDAQKICVPDIQAILDNSDCSQYPNTHPIWDYSLNEPICECISGYVWNKENSACVEGIQQQIANSDCSGYLNTRPVWDEATEQVICDCLPGYVWNTEGTKCVEEWEEAMQNADCSMYPNTEPVWDAVNKEVYCDCLPGYEWADDNMGCEQSITENLQPEGCTQWPNTEPIWDPVSNHYVCDCIPGYVWNNSRTGCIPQRKKPDINFGDVLVSIANGIISASGGTTGSFGANNAESPPSVEPENRRNATCNVVVKSGAVKPEQITIPMGRSFGTFTFEYCTHIAKDRMYIMQGNRKIFDTGCVGPGQDVWLKSQVTMSGMDSNIRVIVNPECEKSEPNTQWSFKVNCLQ